MTLGNPWYQKQKNKEKHKDNTRTETNKTKVRRRDLSRAGLRALRAPNGLLHGRELPGGAAGERCEAGVRGMRPGTCSERIDSEFFQTKIETLDHT